MNEILLQVQNLTTRFQTPSGEVHAVENVSFSIARGETLGLVGESGSGKSVLSLSLMRLISPPGKIVSGEILFRGENLLSKSEREMQAIRGRRIAMIFQEPMTSLNPVMTVGDQIAEAVQLHEGGSIESIRSRTLEMLRLVGIPSPETRIDAYPHEMSGGMRQRVMIAMALACKPDLLIADEPTTALDVTIQAQILELLKKLQRELGMSLLLITHDMGVIAETADRVMVMYAGEVVEEASCQELFASPKHPYTKGLLRAIPPLGKLPSGERLQTIPGHVPSLFTRPDACAFADRCEKVAEKCRVKRPSLEGEEGLRKVRCYFPG